MNVFILNSGRCGSTTFIKACAHITNYSAAHESRVTLGGAARLDYPENHIEADNRLSWLLGRLDRRYGDRAFYVHLHRDPGAAADSFARRYDMGIMKAYREGILMGGADRMDAHAFARDYLDTVESNIGLFLRDKRNRLDVRLENAGRDFRIFWDAIGAEGDLGKALREWEVCYNAG